MKMFLIFVLNSDDLLGGVPARTDIELRTDAFEVNDLTANEDDYNAY